MASWARMLLPNSWCTPVRSVHNGHPLPARGRPPRTRGATLTPREEQVLRALANGRSTAEICAQLGITANTVRTHVQNIMTKLAVHSKLEAVTLALRNDLV